MSGFAHHPTRLDAVIYHAPEDVFGLDGVDPFCRCAFDEVIVENGQGREGAAHVPIIERITEVSVDLGTFVAVVAVAIGVAKG